MKSIYEIYLEKEENRKILDAFPKETQEQVHEFLKNIFTKAEEKYIKPIEEEVKKAIEENK